MPSFLEVRVWPPQRMGLRTKESETVIHFWVAPGGLMRVLLCLFMMALTIVAADDQPVLEVFMPSVLDPWMYPALLQAEAKVNKIYGDIKFASSWRTSYYPMPTGCFKRARYSRIVVDLRENTFTWITAESIGFHNAGFDKGRVHNIKPADWRNSASD